MASNDQIFDEVADQEVVRRMTMLTDTETTAATLKTGELTKQSAGLIKNWRKRWFVLTRWVGQLKSSRRAGGRGDHRR